MQARAMAILDNQKSALTTEPSASANACYKEQIAECVVEKQSIYEDFISKKISLDAFKDHKALIDKKLQELTQSESAAEGRFKEMRQVAESHSSLMELAEKVLAAKSLNRQLVDLLVERIYVQPDIGLDILWKAEAFGQSIHSQLS